MIEECIRTAVQAPTGVNSEGWRFLIVTDPEKKQALADLYRRAFSLYVERAAEVASSVGEQAPPEPKASVRGLAERLHEMPLLIVVCCVGRPEPHSIAQQVAFYGSVLPAAWSLMVALRARGLGSTWTTLHLVHEEESARVLGIPQGVTQTVLLPVAYMKDARLRPADRRPPEEVTYWNAWGNKR